MILDAREQHARRPHCPTCGQPVAIPPTPPYVRPMIVAQLAEPSVRGRVPLACGAFMPVAKDTCARRPGHGGTHRSRYVMDSEAMRRRGQSR